MKRKILSLALAYIMCIALLPPQTAIAADSALTSGQTYYFDLSAQGIPGAVNSALPGGSLKWAPFTYVGEINAYSRQTEGVSTDDTVSVSSRKLFIADYNVTASVSWDSLDSAGLIFGKAYSMYGAEYQLRTPSVGSGSTGPYYSPPLTNEWDQIFQRDGGYIKNYESIASWGQDSASIATDPTTMRIVRAGISRSDYESPAYSYTAAGGVGFRPVLQANSTDLSAITLHLNGGSIGGSVEAIQIVVSPNAGTYPAPDKDGLIRPAESGGTYFRWNTQADGKGTDYETGSNVPISVTTLYAKWAPIEQYSLTTGETYYFDLSGETISGTVNVRQPGIDPGLPDSTLHYVPFTYAGTVDGYNIATPQAVTQEWAEANKSDRSLFISNYIITHTVSWDALNGQNYIFGRDYQYNGILYRLRVPSMGTGEQGAPASNEWSRILEKSGTGIKNSTLYSWGQDTWSGNPANRVIRNDIAISNASSDTSLFLFGFRPVLQIENSGGLATDGLEIITVNLSGGFIGDHTGSIKLVVRNGSGYTAPSDTGITRSAEGAYFMWKGSDNNLYAPGASVPAGVASLTALFQEETGGTPEIAQTVMPGIEGVHGYTGADGYSYVYFGTYNGDPVKWRVLAATGGNSTVAEPASFATGGADTVAAADAMFLLSDSLLGTGAGGDIYFDKDGVKNGGQTNFNEWQGSDAQLWCMDFAGIAGAPENTTDAFTAQEMASILHTTKSDESYAGYAAPDNILNEDKLFFPSAREAETVAYGFINDVTRRALYKGSIGAWWLRSPYGTNASWLVSSESGGGGLGYHNAGDFPLAARPAMNLYRPSVLLSSAAEGGKAGATGALTTVTDYAGNEWKLTLESGLQAVTIDSAVKSGNDVTLTYSGATTGTNQYVSAIVTSADGEEIICYGRLASTSGTASGTVTFTLPGNFDAGGYVLKVFSEQYNGDQCTDYASQPQDVLFAVATAPSITTTSLSSGTVGTPYSQTLVADGDTPITWSIDSGSLPGGLTLTNGAISGIPTAAGTFNFTIRATNAAGFDTRALSIEVSPAPPTGTAPSITTTSLPDGTVGTAYSQTLAADGDTPITWSIDSGSLPGGLTLTNGVISGTPTEAGSFEFTVRVGNSAGSDTQILRIEIIPAAPPGSPPVITTDSLPNAIIFMAYNQTLSVTSDTPVTWSLVGPFPNNGLGFYDGVISGTPLVTGTFGFTVMVTNSAGSVTKEFSITVSPPMPPKITTASLPGGMVGTSYSEPLTADGSTPVTWNIVSGSLPDGLTLTDGGVISGMPTLAGTFTFTVKAENGEGSDTKELHIIITPAGGPGGDTSKRNEPRYIPRTLTGGTPNGMEILVSGERIRTDARLHIARIASSAEGYGAYSEAVGEASEEERLLLSCNIWLTGGFRGRVTISFHVGEAYNGEVITILHYNRNRLETYTAVVEDGWASIVAEDLSPFAVIRTGVTMPDELVPDPPKTGGAQAAGGALLALAACASAVAFRRWRKGV